MGRTGRRGSLSASLDLGTREPGHEVDPEPPSLGPHPAVWLPLTGRRPQLGQLSGGTHSRVAEQTPRFASPPDVCFPKTVPKLHFKALKSKSPQSSA